MPLFTHAELHTKDPQAARAFYGGVFGWTYHDMPMPEGTYTMIQTAEGEMVGGIAQTPNKRAPVVWVGYVVVASVKRTLAKAVRRGGKVVVDFTKVPGRGAYAVLADPQGGQIGLWENAKPSKASAT